MSAANSPSASAEHVEAAEPTRAAAIPAVVVTLAGFIGWGLLLYLDTSSLNDDVARAVGGFTMALTAAGLLVGVAVWLRWHRNVQATRVTAARLNQFHAVMSQTNRLILTRPKPTELLEGVCEVCIVAGQMDAAVVNLFEAGGIHQTLAASLNGPFKATPRQLNLDADKVRKVMADSMLSGGSSIVIEDTLKNVRLSEALSGRLSADLQSLAAVPLRRGGLLVGVLFLCSKAKSHFDGHVTPLVTELSADLSFALDNAERESERKLLLAAEQARLIAEAANRAKTTFLAQMSHELRTPLNAMLGFAQLLATDKEHQLSAPQAERVRLISHAGWHLLGLLNEVMDISRIESGRFEVVNVPLDISSVIDEALALTQPLAQTHHIMLAERAASKFVIGAAVDPRRLLQVLLNLLSNACKYNRPGGHVALTVTHRGGAVVLDVIDNGIGMTPEHFSQLLEPHNRLGNEGDATEGSGIGLTLTRQLVEMMNGRLEFDSSPRGTRVSLVLSSCAVPRSPFPMAVPASRAVREVQRNAVVLYIEDDDVNRMLVEQMLLRCQGVHLLTAENGNEGIALARMSQPDLVLLDMQLPDMTGFEVLTALRRDPATKGMQVVAVSANAVQGDVQKALALGALDYWTKPLNLESFVKRVSALVHSGAPKQPTVMQPLLVNSVPGGAPSQPWRPDA